MKLTTQIPLQKQTHNTISYESKLLLLGSCFVENIGAKLQYYKFQCTINPFGILFHPVAIKNFVERAVNLDWYAANNVFYHEDLWHCFDAHSKLSANTQEEVLATLNKNLETTNMVLNQATHVVLTLGTSWVYRYIESDAIVANCHKVPQKKFLKELLPVASITDALQDILVLLKSVNPKITVIFTVSPVRHLKDGFVENNVSKAHLISAVNSVVSERERVYYFPSYELMMDELRDYRFYEADMIHPSQIAIDYIWEKFKKVWINDNALSTLNQVESIQKALSHKPFNESSEAHKKFKNRLQEQIKTIQAHYPFIEF